MKDFQEYWRVKSARSRALVAGNPATLTVEQWLGILAHFNYQCVYCKQKRFEVIEHIVSIRDGGGTVASNVVPACRSCNTRKAKINLAVAGVQDELNRCLER